MDKAYYRNHFVPAAQRLQDAIMSNEGNMEDRINITMAALAGAIAMADGEVDPCELFAKAAEALAAAIYGFASNDGTADADQ